VAAVLVGATIGWLLPGWLDKRRLVARQRRLMSDMPTVLDLLAIATASGLPLARALEMVSARHDGPFSLELRRALDEAAAGVRLARALKNLAERTGLKAARGFATAVEQATVLGAPVAQVLRLQAGAVRVQRRRQVEMLIAGLPLKLSLCTVFFFLPAIFIFVVLPNLLAFIHGKW
jgi:tight adherence protein C